MKLILQVKDKKQLKHPLFKLLFLEVILLLKKLSFSSSELSSSGVNKK